MVPTLLILPVSTKLDSLCDNITSKLAPISLESLLPDNQDGTLYIQLC